MKISDDAIWLATGDSITDAGRERPLGRGDGLGGGYVHLAAALLTASYPERRIQVLNTGIGGNTVRDLSARWQADVLAHHPGWLSVMIGTNDVWRQFDSYDLSASVMPGEFEQTYTALVRQTRPALDGLIVMSPFYVQPDRADPMRARMDQYGAICARIAAAENCVFVDVQAAFDAACLGLDPLQLAGDRVHPTLIGATVIARALLRALEFEF